MARNRQVTSQDATVSPFNVDSRSTTPRKRALGSVDWRVAMYLVSTESIFLMVWYISGCVNVGLRPTVSICAFRERDSRSSGVRFKWLRFGSSRSRVPTYQARVYVGSPQHPPSYTLARASKASLTHSPNTNAAGRLVDLVVAEPPVADEVDQDVRVELLPPLHSQPVVL